MRAPRLVFAIGAIALVACDDPPRAGTGPAASQKDADRPAPAPKATGPGCGRSGPLESLENDPTCVVDRVPNEDAIAEMTKGLELSVSAEPDVVMAGTSTVLRLVIKNTSTTEMFLVFEAYAHLPGPRPDWTRMAGVPDVKPTAPEVPRLQYTVTTFDARGYNVDAIPTVAGTGREGGVRLIGVRLRAGEKLTRAVSWWALRIPAPAPPVKDDAGHRFVPQTSASALWPGDYTASVELPLHGLTPAQRTVSVKIHVEKSTAVVVPTARRVHAGAPDGGAESTDAGGDSGAIPRPK